MIDLKFEVVRFANEDVIATSGLLGELSGKTGRFYIPSGQYVGGHYDSEYVAFEGTFGSYSNGLYGISGISGIEGGTDIDEEREGLVSPPSYYFNSTGVTVLGKTMSLLANQGYDAFSYDDGQYYSNGVSYYETYWQ